MNKNIALVLITFVITLVSADVYMHNPRGSNDRNCERNVNRNNGNRLFDSQNNAKGGYACPRAVGGPSVDNNDLRSAGSGVSKMEFTAGSMLPIEWTNQHGCGEGNDKLHCDIIIQYACEREFDPTLKYSSDPGSSASGTFVGTPRDGIPRDAQDAATETIPIDEETATATTIENRRFGMHETVEYYQKCKSRSRNKGLFTADQKLKRRDATATRQNPNGQRRGLECPEERDYYPYWHPSPWIDIAALVSDPDRCTDIEAQSQNVQKKGECVGTAEARADQKPQGTWPNNEAACNALGPAKATWVMKKGGVCSNPSFDDQAACTGAGAAWTTRPPVDCKLQEFSRVNHLGNADTGFVGTNAAASDQNDGFKLVGSTSQGHVNANRYLWTVPDTPSAACALRIRYNISTFDYEVTANATINGKDLSPVTQDPYITIGPSNIHFLSLALNTNQYGRTFQDRSYAFAILPKPAAVQGSAQVYNLNVRGKRGNIVQTYPAVEYDFVPNMLQTTLNDFVHFQWTGSDYNPRRGCNNGEGGPPDPPDSVDAAKQNSRADRSNIIEMDLVGENLPTDYFSPTVAQCDKNSNKLSCVSQMLQPAGANSGVESLFRGSMFATNAGTVDAAGAAQAWKMAFLDQDNAVTNPGSCLTEDELNEIRNKNQRENHPRNCAKLNAQKSPYFNGGIIQMRNAGRFNYYSSRNNNFSNRDQTGTICVGSSNNCAGFDTHSGSKSRKAVMKQLVSDVIPELAEDDFLTDDLLGPNEKDNDSLGDGDEEGCEKMNYNFLKGVGPGGIAALTIGLMSIGSVFTLLGVYTLRKKYDKKYRPATGTDASDERAWLNIDKAGGSPMETNPLQPRETFAAADYKD